MEILVGCDPEVFVRDMMTKKIVSAHDMIPGTKKEPFKVDKGAIQVDGTALEFNIDPAHTAVEFVGNVTRVFDLLNQRVKELNHAYKLEPIPVADYSPEDFEAIPVYAKQLGCDPDFNAYTLEPNPPPDGDRPFRTGSGHIHIGWTTDQDPFEEDHFQLCARLTRQLDYYLAIPALLWDRDDRRRELYGNIGAFRPKPYGFEYRVLSNAWLKNKQLIKFVYDTVQYALHLYSFEFRHNPYSMDNEEFFEIYNICKANPRENIPREGMQFDMILPPKTLWAKE